MESAIIARPIKAERSNSTPLILQKITKNIHTVIDVIAARVSAPYCMIERIMRMQRITRKTAVMIIVVKSVPENSMVIAPDFLMIYMV